MYVGGVGSVQCVHILHICVPDSTLAEARGGCQVSSLLNLPVFFEVGSVTKPRARLAASNNPPVLAHILQLCEVTDTLLTISSLLGRCWYLNSNLHVCMKLLFPFVSFP